MIRWLSRLFDCRREGPTPLELARAERLSAAFAVWDAKARKDSRDLHHAQRAYKSATTEVVRLELAGAGR